MILQFLLVVTTCKADLEFRTFLASANVAWVFILPAKITTKLFSIVNQQMLVRAFDLFSKVAALTQIVVTKRRIFTNPVVLIPDRSTVSAGVDWFPLFTVQFGVISHLFTEMDVFTIWYVFQIILKAVDTNIIVADFAAEKFELLFVIRKTKGATKVFVVNTVENTF
jgi:hypothetical protein